MSVDVSLSSKMDRSIVEVQPVCQNYDCFLKQIVRVQALFQILTRLDYITRLPFLLEMVSNTLTLSAIPSVGLIGVKMSRRQGQSEVRGPTSALTAFLKVSLRLTKLHCSSS